MTQKAEKLLALQEIDTRIREAERQIKDIPVRKKDEEQRLSRHRQEAAEAEQALKAKQAEIRKFDLESAARNERIAKLRQQQLELKTNKEFKALDGEIDVVKREIGELEERELALMEQVEKARTELAARQKALAEEQALVNVDVARLDDVAARLNAEIERLRKDRADAATQVESRWLARYETVFTRKDRAIVPLEEGICGGCHMKLPPSVVHDRNRGDNVVVCDYCGRMLY